MHVRTNEARHAAIQSKTTTLAYPDAGASSLTQEGHEDIMITESSCN